jgi:hypothetical protein
VCSLINWQVKILGKKIKAGIGMPKNIIFRNL